MPRLPPTAPIETSRPKSTALGVLPRLTSTALGVLPRLTSTALGVLPRLTSTALGVLPRLTSTALGVLPRLTSTALGVLPRLTSTALGVLSRRAWATLACLSFGVAACSSAGVPEVPAGPDGVPDPVLVAGRQVYSDRCANCHGDDGGGGQGSKLSGGVVLERFPGIADQISVVADGVRNMPAFTEVLTADQIEAVTRFTREVL